MDPLVELRARLVDDRAERKPFALAWRAAIRVALAGEPAVERGHWQAALNATRDAWEDAYDGQRPERGHAALVLVGSDRDGRRGRFCEFCSDPIPEHRGPGTKFCTTQCQKGRAKPAAALAA